MYIKCNLKACINMILKNLALGDAVKTIMLDDRSNRVHIVFIYADEPSVPMKWVL